MNTRVGRVIRQHVGAGRGVLAPRVYAWIDCPGRAAGKQFRPITWDQLPLL
jgi:hypothetical protein